MSWPASSTHSGAQPATEVTPLQAGPGRLCLGGIIALRSDKPYIVSLLQILVSLSGEVIKKLSVIPRLLCYEYFGEVES